MTRRNEHIVRECLSVLVFHRVCVCVCVAPTCLYVPEKPERTQLTSSLREHCLPAATLQQLPPLSAALNIEPYLGRLVTSSSPDLHMARERDSSAATETPPTTAAVLFLAAASLVVTRRDSGAGGTRCPVLRQPKDTSTWRRSRPLFDLSFHRIHRRITIQV